jgi:hypothetical protein
VQGDEPLIHQRYRRWLRHGGGRAPGARRQAGRLGDAKKQVDAILEALKQGEGAAAA